MKVWNRVLTSIKRRISQTLTMFFVVFILGNVLFAAIAVRQTSTQVENNLRSRVPSTIRISENVNKNPSAYEHERLLELIDDLESDERVTGITKITKIKGAKDVEQDEYGMSFAGEGFLCLDNYALLDGIEIIEGRNFTKEEFEAGANKIILNEYDKWAYSIGDIYTVVIYDYEIVETKYDWDTRVHEAKTFEFEVIGFSNGYF